MSCVLRRLPVKVQVFSLSLLVIFLLFEGRLPPKLGARSQRPSFVVRRFSLT